MGSWAEHEIRTTEIPGCRAASFGVCLATAAELAAVLAKACRSGDYTGLTALPGNHVTVVEHKGGVTIVTDLAGLHPVFSTPWAGGAMFASSPLPLAHLTGSGPDLEWLTAALLCPSIPEAAGERSSFRGISRTRPGHMLILDSGGSWQEEQLPVTLGGSSFDEGARAVRIALVTAVDRRAGLGQPITADLSGGLDSSTLALMMAARLPGGLPTITYADPVSGGTDDLAYARLCVAAEPKLDQIIVTGDETTLPFTSLDRIPLLDEPSQDTLLSGRTAARLAPAAAHNSRLHVSGDGGDIVLAGGLTYLADLVRARRIGDMVCEATAWARLRHRPARRVIAAAVRLALTDYPDAVRGAADLIRHGGELNRRGVEDHLTWCALSPAAAWATRLTRRDLADRLEETAETLRGQRRATADTTALRDVRWNGGSSRSFSHLADHFGVPVHVPFLDNQVVAACMSVSVADPYHRRCGQTATGRSRRRARARRAPDPSNQRRLHRLPVSRAPACRAKAPRSARAAAAGRVRPDRTQTRSRLR